MIKNVFIYTKLTKHTMFMDQYYDQMISQEPRLNLPDFL